MIYALRRGPTQIALAVGMGAQKDGVALKDQRRGLRLRVLDTQWTPAYPSFVWAEM